MLQRKLCDFYFTKLSWALIYSIFWNKQCISYQFLSIINYGPPSCLSSIQRFRIFVKTFLTQRDVKKVKQFLNLTKTTIYDRPIKPDTLSKH